MSNNKKKQLPPRWAKRLLKWYCAPHLLEEIEGDLEEEFEYQLKYTGLRSAQIDYIRNVLGFIKPFAIKRKTSTNPNSFLLMNMYKHYLTVASRNLVRNKAFSFINITGLALGMMCCLFIFLWIKDEQSVDNFHINGDRLYNVYETANINNVITGSYTTSRNFVEGRTYLPLADVKEAVPEVEYINFYATGYELPWGYPETFQVGEIIHKLEGSRATEDFFTMFSYPVIAGNAIKALSDPSS
ncbi:permease prefix domain 2-containing transporter, partial [Chryseosolibacter indicus]